MKYKYNVVRGPLSNIADEVRLGGQKTDNLRYTDDTVFQNRKEPQRDLVLWLKRARWKV